jgi:nucleotide-binding universal stress UspA family protein
MALRDLVVLLDGSDRDSEQLRVAVDLAQRDEAHLTGLCTLDTLAPVIPGPSLGGYPQILALQGIAQEIEEFARDKARGIERVFREALRANGLPGDWCLALGAAADVAARRVRCADVLVAGQSDPAEAAALANARLIEEILLTAGRPLLLVPYAGHFLQVGARVLIAWNGSREASRALHDALPLLRPAAKVTVLTVQTPREAAEGPEIPGGDVAAHLARHGVEAAAARTVTDGNISVADALLGYASDVGADLLVMGGYGRSRVREFVLGGVTREILNHMTLPVLISH